VLEARNPKYLLFELGHECALGLGTDLPTSWVNFRCGNKIICLSNALLNNIICLDARTAAEDDTHHFLSPTRGSAIICAPIY